MGTQRIKTGLHRIGAALAGLPLARQVRNYLTTRWWMPLVIYWIALIGLFISIMQVLRWTNVMG